MIHDINEFLHKLPDDFRILDSLSKLVKMEHYGMKTELLDLTENPLMAFYFACITHRELDDGSDRAMYIINNAAIHYSEDLLVQLTMDYAFNYAGFSLSLEETELLFNFTTINTHGRRRIQILDDLTILAFCVAPKLNNERLIAQQGPFICFRVSLNKIKTSNNIGNYEKNRYIFFLGKLAISRT